VSPRVLYCMRIPWAERIGWRLDAGEVRRDSEGGMAIEAVIALIFSGFRFFVGEFSVTFGE